jgi:hypothetical protein
VAGVVVVGGTGVEGRVAGVEETADKAGAELKEV